MPDLSSQRPSRPFHLLAAAAAGTAAACFVAACVYAYITPVRLRLTRTPVVVDRVFMLGDPLVVQGRALASPLAIIGTAGHARLTQQLRVELDGEPVCDISVEPGAPRRFDCATTAPLRPSGTHTLAIAGTGRWTLDSLEVATHHGRTSGPLDLFILPRNSQIYAPASRLGAALAGFLVALLLGCALPPWPRWARFAHRVASGVVMAVLAVVAAAPYVSAFRLVVSWNGAVLAVAVLLAPRLWTALQRLVPRARRGAAAYPLIACVAVGILTASAYGALVSARLSEFQGNYSGLLQISRTAFDRSPLMAGRDDVRRTLVLQDGGGYDGQFLYFMTFDPLLRQFHDRPEAYVQAIDDPVYRYGRVGFSALSKMAAFGRWQYTPAAMVWLVLAGIGTFAAVLGRLAQRHGRSTAWGLLAMLVPGFWCSTQTALPEPVTAALLAMGVLLAHRHREWAAAAVIALSLLIRETGGVLALAVAWMIWRERGHAFALRWLVATIAPLAVWRLYVGAILHPALGFSAFIANPHDLTVPFAGLAELWLASWRGTYMDGGPYEVLRAGVAYPIVLTAGIGLALWLLAARRSAIAVAAVVYGVVAVSLNFTKIWVHVANGQRGTFELFVMIALATVTLPLTRRLQLGLYIFWGLAGWYVFFGTYDASYIRSALL